MHSQLIKQEYVDGPCDLTGYVVEYIKFIKLDFFYMEIGFAKGNHTVGMRHQVFGDTEKDMSTFRNFYPHIGHAIKTHSRETYARSTGPVVANRIVFDDDSWIAWEGNG